MQAHTKKQIVEMFEREIAAEPEGAMRDFVRGCLSDFLEECG